MAEKEASHQRAVKALQQQLQEAKSSPRKDSQSEQLLAKYKQAADDATAKFNAAESERVSLDGRLQKAKVELLNIKTAASSDHSQVQVGGLEGLGAGLRAGLASPVTRLGIAGPFFSSPIALVFPDA